MKMFKKRFNEWILLKEKIHERNYNAPYVSEGEIWWASVGENVGSEIDGKSSLFSRPVLIYKKLSHHFYFVVPTTTKDKTGSWYVQFKHRGKKMVACLQQSRSMDYRRLSSKLGEMDGKAFRNYIHKKIFPTSGEMGPRENPECRLIISKIS